MWKNAGLKLFRTAPRKSSWILCVAEGDVVRGRLVLVCSSSSIRRAVSSRAPGMINIFEINICNQPNVTQPNLTKQT